MACLAACNGAGIHPVLASQTDLASFRELVRDTCAGRKPRCMAGDPGWHLPSFLVVSYSRKALNQTGDGHYSPVGGYHEEKDLVLILDVARFKYPPHWVPLPLLWEAMSCIDPATQHSRGFMLCWAQPPLPTSLFTVSCRTACAVERLPRLGTTGVGGGSGGGGSGSGGGSGKLEASRGASVGAIEGFLRSRVEGVPPGVPEGNAAASVIKQALQASEAREGVPGGDGATGVVTGGAGVSPVDGSVRVLAASDGVAHHTASETSHEANHERLHDHGHGKHHDNQSNGLTAGTRHAHDHSADHAHGHSGHAGFTASTVSPPSSTADAATGVTAGSKKGAAVAARAPCSKAPKDVSCPSCWGGAPPPVIPPLSGRQDGGLHEPDMPSGRSNLQGAAGSDSMAHGTKGSAMTDSRGAELADDGSLDAWREPTEGEQALMCLMMDSIPQGGEDIIDVVAGVEGGLEGAIRAVGAQRLAEGDKAAARPVADGLAGAGAMDASTSVTGGGGGVSVDAAGHVALEDQQARVLADLMNTRLFRTVLQVLVRRDASQGECGMLARWLHQEDGDAVSTSSREGFASVGANSSGSSSDEDAGVNNGRERYSGHKGYEGCVRHGHGEETVSAAASAEPTLGQRARAVRMALLLSLIPPEQWKEFLERAPGREARKDAIISSLLAMHLEHRTLGSEVGHLRQQVQGLLTQVPDACCGGTHGAGVGGCGNRAEATAATGTVEQPQARSCGAQNRYH
eukprot:jgi/Mesvir1/14833/Mv05459-RA.1